MKSYLFPEGFDWKDFDRLIMVWVGIMVFSVALWQGLWVSFFTDVGVTGIRGDLLSILCTLVLLIYPFCQPQVRAPFAHVLCVMGSIAVHLLALEFIYRDIAKNLGVVLWIASVLLFFYYYSRLYLAQKRARVRGPFA